MINGKIGIIVIVLLIGGFELIGLAGGMRGKAFAASAPTLEITQANAVELAGTAVNTLGVVGRFMFSSLFRVIVNPYTDTLKQNLQLRHLTGTHHCELSGTIDVTTGSDRIGLKEGDWITAMFNDCDHGLGILTSGLISVTVQENIAHQPNPPYSYILLSNWENYTETEFGDTRRINGRATLREGTEDNIVFDGNISGSFLSYSDTDGDSTTLSDFMVTKTIDTSTFSYDYFAYAFLESENLGGSVRYSTTKPLIGFSHFPPSQGVVTIIGKSSTGIMTVEDGINLTIEIDEDGDGSIDHSTPTSWDEL